MISMPSFAPSASKSHDKGAKREQNPPYSHYNGLNALASFAFSVHCLCSGMPAATPWLAGHDTWALQKWLGHWSIQHTVRYTELSPTRFKDFWRD
jgi:hypothetical protein